MTEYIGQWTLEDLQGLPDNGFRYEISDGSLVVSPAPAKPHLRVVLRLRKLLLSCVPTGAEVCENVGILMGRGRTYRIPDLTVVKPGAVEGDDANFEPAEVMLAIEVISPDSEGDDVRTKRYQYGRAGIPHYWIVDPKTRTLTVLVHNGEIGYDERAVVPAGQTWQTDQPFPLSLDPAEFS